MSGRYIGIENLNLNATQRGAVIAAIRALGPQNQNDDPSPARINHFRVRLDGQAAIFEAAFPDGSVSIESVKNYLSSAVGVNPSTVTHAVQNTAYGPLVTYSRSGVNYVRLLQFGSAEPTWEESGDAARAFLAANSIEWESE